MNTARGAGLGLAIATDRIVARTLGEGGGERLSWQRALAAATADAAPAADRWREQLRDALRSLRTAAPGARTLHVALLPPLAEVRTAALPAIDTDDLRLALERDAAKYFPVGAERQVVTARPVGAVTAGFALHLLASSPAHVIDDVLAAAEAAGWRVDSLAPAQLAWAKAARARQGAGGAAHSAVVRFGDREDVFDVKDGAIVRVQRRRASSAPDAASSRTLASSLDDALDLAARFAALPDERSLWPAAVRAARDQAAWRSAGRTTAAAAALVALALAVAWGAAGRDVERIAAERRALRPRVTAAMAARDSLSALNQRVVLLRGFGAGAPRWSSVLIAIGDALPADASLISVRSAGDTLILTGEAEHAATVFGALARSRRLTGVRAEAPIQQIVENGEVVAERFTIAAHLAPARPE